VDYRQEKYRKVAKVEFFLENCIKVEYREVEKREVSRSEKREGVYRWRILE
jgi:hypothetical protein